MLAVSGNLKRAAAVSALRCTCSAILLGTLFSPFYILSLSGALCSNLAVGLTVKLKKDMFSITGLAILGALASNMSQLCLAALVLKQKEVFAFLPLFLIMSLISGAITGEISRNIIPRWNTYTKKRMN